MTATTRGMLRGTRVPADRMLAALTDKELYDFFDKVEDRLPTLLSIPESIIRNKTEPTTTKPQAYMTRTGVLAIC
jgi:hypothetical protein